MRPTLLLLLLLLGTQSGCDSADKTPAEAAAAKATVEQGEQVRKETKEAVSAMQDYAFARKAEFIADMKAKLAALQIEIEALEAKVAASAGEAKADADGKLVEVRAKWGATKTKLDLAEAATESNWEGVKNDVKQAHQDLEQSFDDTRQWLSEKIAPGG